MQLVSAIAAGLADRHSDACHLQALAELQAYMHSAAFQHGSAADAALSRQLHESLSQLASASIPSPLCIDSARRTPQPHVSDERRLPLTW